MKALYLHHLRFLKTTISTHLDVTPLRDELHLIDRMNSADLQSLFASMTALDAVTLPEPVQHDLPSLLSRPTATSSDGDTVSTLNSFFASIVPNGSHDRDPLNHSSNFSVPTAAHDCSFLSPAVSNAPLDTALPSGTPAVYGASLPVVQSPSSVKTGASPSFVPRTVSQLSTVTRPASLPRTRSQRRVHSRWKSRSRVGRPRPHGVTSKRYYVRGTTRTLQGIRSDRIQIDLNIIHNRIVPLFEYEYGVQLFEHDHGNRYNDSTSHIC